MCQAQRAGALQNLRFENLWVRYAAERGDFRREQMADIFGAEFQPYHTRGNYQ